MLHSHRSGTLGCNLILHLNLDQQGSIASSQRLFEATMAVELISTQSLYKSLSINRQGDIRLVNILETREGKISCQLRTVNLEHSPAYFALSYTWGPSTDRETARGGTSAPSRQILCNNILMHVTENLHNFLCRAAADEDLASRDIWIDFISINQEDSIERASQVNQMARIYRSAEAVVIWLGEEEDNIHLAFELMRDLSRLNERQLNKITPSALSRRTSEVFKLLPGHGIDSSWLALSHLFRRRYFTRTWTLQEVYLGRKRIGKCGNHSIDWECVTNTSKFLTETSWTRWLRIGSHHQVPNLIEATRRTNLIAEGDSLLYALIRFRRYQVSDPRDKVYALLGLVSDSIKQSPLLLPSYKEQSVENTYILAAIYLLENTDHLLLLAHTEGSPRKNEERLPSWVPDWRCTDVIGLGVTGYTRFTAAGDVPRTLHIDKKRLTLTLRGTRLDQIEHISETKKEILEGKPFPRLLSMIHMLPNTYHTGETAFEVLWRSLITNTSGPPSQYPASLDFGQFFLEWFLHKLNLTAHLLEQGLLAGLSDFMKRHTQGYNVESAVEKFGKDQYETVTSHAQHLRPFLSKNHFFGIGAEDMQPGDCLWVVAGCRVPLVLRESSTGAFRIVGGAYVHGFMNGEALSNGIPWSDLVIV